MAGKQQRRRVSREEVRQNAKEAGGGRKLLSLPDHVREWWPESADTYRMNFLPYEVSIDNHPDKIEKGMLWYKFPYQVHKNVGPNEESILCPGSIGKPCPICQDVQKLTKNYEANKESIEALRAQKFVAYNIEDPDDADKAAVFALSRGKFANALDKELEEGPEENLNFYDVTDEGKTLEVRFSKEKFKGSEYMQASRIDFKDREPMDEEETLKKVACLDELFKKVLPYDKLKALYLQVDPATVSADPGTAASTGRAKASPTAVAAAVVKPAVTKPSTKSAAKPAAAPVEADAEPSPIVVGATVKFEVEGIELTGEVTEVDDEDVTVKDTDGEEHILDIEDVQLADEDEETAEPEDKPETESEGDDDKPKWKVGDRVAFTNDEQKEIVGEVTDIDDDDVIVKGDDGEDHDADVDDLRPAPAKAEKKPKDAKPEAAKPSAKAAAKPHVFAVGDEVSWDKGAMEGTILKVKPEAGKAKIKNEDEKEVWKTLAELTLVKAAAK